MCSLSHLPLVPTLHMLPAWRLRTPLRQLEMLHPWPLSVYWIESEEGYVGVLASTYTFF